MITNGYDEDDFFGPVESDGLFNIVHTGLFADDGNPLTLWKVLGEKVANDPHFKEKMRLRLVGKVDKGVMEAIEREGLAENVINLGYKAHEVAVREQRAASRRPILGIGQEDGAMARVFDDIAIPGRVVCEWDNEDKTRTFVDWIWNNYLGEEDALLPPDGIECFSRRAITKELAALLDSQVVK